MPISENRTVRFALFPPLLLSSNTLDPSPPCDGQMWLGPRKPMARTNPTRPSFPVHTVVTLAVGSPNGTNYTRSEADVRSDRRRGGRVKSIRGEEKRSEESKAVWGMKTKKRFQYELGNLGGWVLCAPSVNLAPRPLTP